MSRPTPTRESEFAEAVRVARAGRHAEAVDRVERLADAGPPSEQRSIEAADSLSHIARLAEAAGDMGQAQRALEIALRLRPDYPDLHCRRARLLVSLHRRPEARQALDRALALNPRYTAARLERALLDAADGFIGEALESLRALARDASVEKPGVFQQGIESLERADWEEAGALLNEALAQGRPLEERLLDRARSLLEQGDAARAAEVLQEALPGRESWPDLHYLLGAAELKRGHFDDALASLARALELNPDFHAARVQFACALEAVGSLPQACEQIALVLQQDPGHPQATELHERWTSHRRRTPQGRSARSGG